MNNDLANKIKSSLENYEVPYDASAWDGMSKRLDANSASSGNNFLSSPKTWIVASITVIGASIAMYSITKDADKPSIASHSTKIETPTAVEKEEKKVELINEEKKVNTSVSTSKVKASPVANSTTPNRVNETHTVTPAFKANSSTEVQATKPVQNNKVTGNERHLKNIIFPKTNKFYCLGEKLEVYNPNNVELTLISSTGTYYKIDGQESLLIPLKNEGQYSWNQGDKVAFEVKEKPIVNFNLPSDIIYEDGIPTITLSTNLNVKSKKWLYDQKVISTGDEVKLNIFNKEKYAITLSVVGQNGCENHLTRIFYPEIDYNLQAPTGFEPTSSNPKRNTFLPLSLLERDTPFRMIIIDPKDGKVIFETTDKNEPWDGKNQKTDQLVPEGGEYIWKVTLMKPEKNEKNEYRGTITRK